MGRRIEFRITAGACIIWAMMLLVLPLRWVAGILLASTVHELWHLAAIYLCGGDVFGIRIGAGGILMEIPPQSRWRELVCAAAGPAGSFSLLLTAKYLPVTAVCGMIQGIFNLIPVFPLDGGRVVRSCFGLLFPNKGLQISRYVENGYLVLILTGGVIGIIKSGMSVWVLLLAAVPVMKLLHQKKTLQRCESGGTIEIH